MELGLIKPHTVWFLGPNSRMALYLDPLGNTATPRTGSKYGAHSSGVEALNQALGLKDEPTTRRNYQPQGSKKVTPS